MTIFIGLVPPFLSTLQWGTGMMTSNNSITLSLPIEADILTAIPFDISNTASVYPVAWDSTTRNAVRIFCANSGDSNTVGYVAICR